MPARRQGLCRLPDEQRGIPGRWLDGESQRPRDEALDDQPPSRSCLDGAYLCQPDRSQNRARVATVEPWRTPIEKTASKMQIGNAAWRSHPASVPAPDRGPAAPRRKPERCRIDFRRKLAERINPTSPIVSEIVFGVPLTAVVIQLSVLGLRLKGIVAPMAAVH